MRLKPSAGETRQVAKQLMSDAGGTLGPVFGHVLKGFAAKVSPVPRDVLERITDAAVIRAPSAGFSQGQLYGKGLAAGVAIVVLGVMLDRLTQAAAKRWTN